MSDDAKNTTPTKKTSSKKDTTDASTKVKVDKPKSEKAEKVDKPKKNKSKKSDKSDKSDKSKKSDKTDKPKSDAEKSEKPKKQGSTKVPKTKAVKGVAADAEPAVPRRFNDKPTLADVAGFTISPAKVKNIVANNVLNKDTYAALVAIRAARPHTESKTDASGVVTDTPVAGVPLTSLNSEVKAVIASAMSDQLKALREDYAHDRVSKFQDAVKARYVTHRKALKAEHDKAQRAKVLETTESFNPEKCNVDFDKDFYGAFVAPAKPTGDDAYKVAADAVTKLKNRFSTDSRIYLSAFVELIVKQLTKNGTYNCINDNKRIIKLSHALDASKPGFDDRFPLHPLIVNLSTYKKAVAYVNAPASDDGKVEPEFEDFGVDKSSQFYYYINEIARGVRMELASSEVDEEGKAQVLYNYTSVSRDFKKFCSAIITEFLIRVGHMLSKEIETRGVKTVNDTIIGTVISHYHTVSGVDEKPTVEHIRKASAKYMEYVSSRQVARADAKSKNTTK
jgi:hypothetical protein